MHNSYKYFKAKEKIVMENLLNALGQFKDKKVIVVGDVMLDTSIMGTGGRTNPESLEALMMDDISIDYRLGGAANVARNIASLGASCYLLGQIGDDAPGKEIAKLCKKEGIESYFVVDPGRETIVKLRMLVDGRYVLRANIGEKKLRPMDYEKGAELEEGLSKEIGSCNLVIFSDYNKGVFKAGLERRTIQEIKNNKRKILTLADPKPENISNFFGCDVLRPNKKEAEEIAGIKDNGSNLGEIASSLAEKTRSRYVAITCGGDGAFIFTKDTEKNYSELVPTKKVPLADTIGAGDTFATVLGLGMVSGLDFKDSVRLANYASAIVVGKRGTATTNVEELERVLKDEGQR